MKREFLEKLKIEKEVVDQIMAEHGKTVQGLNSQIDTLKASETGLKDQLTQRDKDLADLKKNAGDSEELKTKYDDLQAKYKADTKELGEKITDAQVTAAIKVAVAATAHDPDLVASQVDKTKITLNDDGSVKMGLDEQLKSLQEGKAFLFKGKTDGAPGVKGGAGPAGSGDNDPDPGSVDEAVLNAAFGIQPAQSA
jgi:chromosome segregation ATPase